MIHDVPLSLSENLVQASYTPEAVCCCLQTCNFGFDMRTVPVDQVLAPDNFLMPEAICCCLQTCKCGFDIRVVLCGSLIDRNATTTKL